MCRHRLALLAATTLLLPLVPAAPAPADTLHTGSGADAVRAWNEVAMSTLVTGLVPVPEQPLYLAYVHRAAYFGVRRAVRRDGDASVAATVASAAHTVLSTQFPAQRAALDDALDTSLSAVADDSERRLGVRIGRRAAHRLLARRADDGRNGMPVPVPSPAPGVWRPTPPNTTGLSSWLGRVRPFALRSPSEVRPGPPPALGSRRWARDFEEVRAVGGTVSTTRTAAQTEVARFWSDPPYVQNQQGLREYTDRAGLGAVATARLFARADTAAADAIIACWDAKYTYHFWRPVTAVPAGDSDGNPATVGDPAWTPLLGTPNHPEYPSAHSCATTALAVVVGASHRGRLDLDLTSSTTGTTRHYSSVRQLTSEVSNARIWGGIHWRSSTRAGERIGRAAGHRVLARAAQHR